MKARGPGQSALLLLDVIKVLTRSDVDYVVVGAMAASVHGAMRATLDADALLSIPAAKAGLIEKALKQAGFITNLRRGDAEDPIAALLAVTDRHGNRVDLLVGLQGADPLLFSRSVPVPFHGADLRIVGREDFIAMKCFAGGRQDVSDAREALAVCDSPLDLDLLRRLARRFGRPAADVLEKVLAVPRQPGQGSIE